MNAGVRFTLPLRRSAYFIFSSCPDPLETVYLRPKAPAGKEANWLATVPGKHYFVILSLYGPTEAAINKSWNPRDIEKMQSRKGGLE